MSLFNEAQKKSETVGTWQPHPLGKFPAVFTGIQVGEHEGRRFYQINMKTHEGAPRTTVWETFEQDVDGRLLQRENGDLAKAQKSYLDTMARTLHLYNVAGLPRPDSEAMVYQNLGQLVGRACVVELKRNPKDDKNPYCNVYPPDGAQGAAPTHDKAASFTASAANGGHALSAVPNLDAPAPDLSDIPF